MIELHLAQHWMLLQMLNHLLLGQFVRVDEFRVDAFLRVLAVMLNRSHNQRVLTGLEQWQHLYLSVCWIHLLPCAQQTVLAEVLQVEEFLKSSIALKRKFYHLFCLIRHLQQPIREVINLQRLFVLFLIQVLEVILEAKITAFLALLKGHKTEQQLEQQRAQCICGGVLLLHIAFVVIRRFLLVAQQQTGQRQLPLSSMPHDVSWVDRIVSHPMRLVILHPLLYTQQDASGRRLIEKRGRRVPVFQCEQLIV